MPKRLEASYHPAQATLMDVTPESWATRLRQLRQIREARKQMASLKDTAKAYEGKEFKNISDLDKVSVNIDLKDGEGTNKEGETFTYQYFEEEGTEYRVPKTVLKQLKAHLETNDKIEFFKVHKAGSGLNTEYTVVPL